MRRTLVIALLFALFATPSLTQSEELNEEIDRFGKALGEGADAFFESYLDERNRPWRLTMEPSGELWFWQNSSKDPMVTWDFGARIYVEFARGRGHRIWWGGEYREAAGFKPDQKYTPFNPKHIDTAQFLSWRWAPSWRRALFVYMQRWCYHEIDVRNPSAEFFTNAALGLGTISPAERGEAVLHSRRTGKPMLNFYVYGGPFLYGGPLNVLGRAPNRQWEASGYISLTAPVKKWLILELYGRYDANWLVERSILDFRNRGFSRFALHFAAPHGTASLYVGRTWHDNFLDRQWPVSWYGGTSYRF